jgi:hypothetical protein
VIAASASENFTTVIPAYKDKLIGFGNIKGLCVSFFMGNIDVSVNSCGNWMRRINNPETLSVTVFTPRKIASCTCKKSEGF